MEISFSVSNDQWSLGRAATGDKGETTPIPLKIEAVSDLKKAEMQGANYSVGDEQKIKMIEHAIKAIQGKTTSLRVSIHEGTGAIMVKVLDKDTGEVIREVPPEKTLDLVAKFCEMAGLFVDEKR